jgi:hypothetical protein
MKQTAWFFAVGFILSGCSKTDEMTDQAATNLASRIKTPVEQAREASAKAAATRGAEMPK